MTDTPKKPGKLARELLRLIAISMAAAAVVLLAVSSAASTAAQIYCFQNDVYMDEFAWIALDRWIFSISGVLACCVFIVLFLSQLSGRMAYIRRITQGIDDLREPSRFQPVPLEGNNELTGLAGAVNALHQAQNTVREREQTLSREKDTLIRTLSHDIRTPLTALVAYTEFLAAGELTAEQQSHVALIRKKAAQIRELTDVLLDGTRRSLERFDDCRLLMEQLAWEFAEELEGQFTVETDLSGCPAFPGSFDVQELQRVFDNLLSNVRKYADPAAPVTLRLALEDGALVLRQRNRVRPQPSQGDSLGLGLGSIRRIAQLYGGSVHAGERDGVFEILVIFPDF